jgi:hypothetical protein
LLTIGPPVLAALLALPFVATQNAWLEWANAYWLLETQAEHVRATGLPTVFLHLPHEAFYPFHLLYAGWTFALLAYPAALFGAWPVFAATSILAFVGIERGVTWFARNLGAPASTAPLAGLAMVATPYVVSDLYGRGAWSELIALTGAALALGAGSAVLGSTERVRIRDGAALALSVALVAGSHGLTLLMAALVLPFIIATALLGGVIRPTPRTALTTGALVVLGVGLTAAYLLPAVDFGPDTYIAGAGLNAQARHGLDPYYTARILFSPWPRMPDVGGWHSTFYSHASLILLLWPVAAAIVLRKRLTRRVGWALAIAGVAQVVLIWWLLRPGLWDHFPQAIQTIQFPVRLIPWLALVGATATAVLLARGASGRLVTVLAGLVAVQVVIGLGIAFTTHGLGVHVPIYINAVEKRNIHAAPPPKTFITKGLSQPNQFLVFGQGYQTDPTAPSGAKLAPRRYDALRDDALTLIGDDPPGTLRYSEIVWSPWVRLSGDASIVGRDNGGYAIVRVDRAADGHWTAQARQACGACLHGLKGGPLFSIALGRLLSALSALTLLAWAAVVVVRRRRAAPTGPDPAPAPPPAPPAPRSAAATR